MARMKIPAEELQKRRRARELKRKMMSSEAKPSGPDATKNKGDDVCAICDNGGSLTCCDGGCKRSFHLVDDASCRMALGLTKRQAKAVIDAEEAFVCENCKYKRHQCFACGFLGSSDLSSPEPEVFQCEREDCGRFYHPKCVAKLLYDGEEATLFEHHVTAGFEFDCPMHECIVCRKVENKDVEDLQFAVCRRCPTTYHRKCLPEEILFRTKKKKGGNGSMCRAWDNILPDRILIFCMRHDIDRKLKTPARDHIVFPEDAEKLGAASVPAEYTTAPMEKQDVSERDDLQEHPFSEPSPSPPSPAARSKKQSFSKGTDEQRGRPFSGTSESPPLAAASNKNQCFSKGTEQLGRPFSGASESPPLAAASNKKQCSCYGHMDTFAPKSLFMHPQPGSCGWIDDD